jgi:hypothetical protein
MRSGYLKRGSTAESFCFPYSACHLHPLGYSHLVTFLGYQYGASESTRSGADRLEFNITRYCCQCGDFEGDIYTNAASGVQKP